MFPRPIVPGSCFPRAGGPGLGLNVVTAVVAEAFCSILEKKSGPGPNSEVDCVGGGGGGDGVLDISEALTTHSASCDMNSTANSSPESTNSSSTVPCLPSSSVAPHA